MENNKIRVFLRECWLADSFFKKMIGLPYYLCYRIIKKSDPSIPTDLFICSKDSSYLAIWKCGTNTIREIIKKQNGLKIFPLWNKKEVKKIKKGFVFTFVRNPYSRVLAVYLDKQKNQSSYDYTYNYRGPLKKLTGKKINFETFVKEVVKISSSKLDAHLKPYSEFTKWVPKLDFVGKLENFNEDWNCVAEKIGYPKAKKIKTSNRNKKGYSLDDYYTPELKELIYEKYKDDFERFGYKK